MVVLQQSSSSSHAPNSIAGRSLPSEPARMSEYFDSRPSSRPRAPQSDDEEPKSTFEAYFKRREAGQRVGNADRRRNHNPTSDDEDDENSFAAYLRRRDTRRGGMDVVPGRDHHPSNGHQRGHNDWESNGRSSSPYERQIASPSEEYSRGRSGRSFFTDREEHLHDEHPQGYGARRQLSASNDEDHDERYEAFDQRWDEGKNQHLRRQQSRYPSPQDRNGRVGGHHTPDHGAREWRISGSVEESARTRAIDEERRKVMRRIFGDDFYEKKYEYDKPEEPNTSYEGPGW